MEKQVIFLFCLILLAGCKRVSNTRQTVDIIALDMKQAVPEDFTEWIENISCVVLDDSPESYFRSCWDLIEYRDYLYIHSLSDFMVYIFKKDGSFVRTLPRRGTGMVELPMSLFIDKEKEQLVVIDGGAVLKRFTLNGDYVSQQVLPSAVSSAYIADKDTYILLDDKRSGSDAGHYLIYDPERNRVTDSYIPKANKRVYSSLTSYAFAFDPEKDHIYSTIVYRDTLYKIDKAVTPYHVTPYLHLDFKGDLLTEAQFPAEGFTDKEFSELLADNAYINSWNGIYYAAGKLFFRVTGKEEAFYAISTDNHSVYKFTKLMEGFIPASPVESTIAGVFENGLCFVFRHSELRAYYKDRPSAWECINSVISPRDRDPWIVVFITLKKE